MNRRFVRSYVIALISCAVLVALGAATAAHAQVLTFTNYTGFDPEVSTFTTSNTAPGTDFLTFPQARTMLFGLNLGF